MDVFLISVTAFAPGIFWLWYFYKRDKIEPEPKKLIIKIYFLGMAAVIPAVLIELPFMYAGQIFVPVIIAPIVEELIKFLFVKNTIYKNTEFDEPMDGIVYAAAIALGFASLENVGYLIQVYLKPETVSGILGMRSPIEAVSIIFVVRALLTVPGHALWSCMWGWGLGFAKFSDEEKGKKYIRNGIILSILSHGAFNFLLVINPIFALGMIILVPLLWFVVNKKIKESLKASPHKTKKSHRDNHN